MLPAFTVNIVAFSFSFSFSLSLLAYGLPGILGTCIVCSVWRLGLYDD